MKSKLFARIISSAMVFITFVFLPFGILISNEYKRNDVLNNGLIIGAKSFPEGEILGNIEKQMINYWTNIPTSFVTGLTGGFVPNAFTNKNIDTITEYSGTISDIYWGDQSNNIRSKPITSFNLLDFQNHMNDFDSTKDLSLIYSKDNEGLGFENKYVLVAKSGTSFSKVKSLNELFNNLNGKIGAASDVINKYGTLQKIYEIATKKTISSNKDPNYARENLNNLSWDIKQINQSFALYNSLKNGNINIGISYSTDAHLNDDEFKVLDLADMNKNFNPYESVFLIRNSKLKKFSNIRLKHRGLKSNSVQSSLEKILQAIKISTKEMIYMNQEYNDKTGYEIAKKFLEKKKYFEINL